MSGIEELLAGGLGIAFQSLFEAVKDAKATAKKFKPTLESLENTVNLLTPMIREMENLHQELKDNSREQIRVLHERLEEGKEIVSTCSKIRRWDKFKRHKYGKRLAELDSFLSRVLTVEFQAAQWVDILKIRSKLTDMDKKLDQMNQENKNDRCATSENSSSPRVGATAVVKEESSKSQTESGSTGKSSFGIRITKERSKQVKDASKSGGVQQEIITEVKTTSVGFHFGKGI